jgi:hypothetical protein
MRTRPTTRRLFRSALAAASAVAACATSARADEGMWLFNQPPAKVLKDRYDFDAAPAWLEHLQQSAV